MLEIIYLDFATYVHLKKYNLRRYGVKISHFYLKLQGVQMRLLCDTYEYAVCLLSVCFDVAKTKLNETHVFLEISLIYYCNSVQF